MSEFEQESLSALLDGEADELELRRLLKSIDSEPELARRWERYHLAQSVLHERGIPVKPSLADGVAAALQQESAHTPRSFKSGQWQRQLSRVAIAACVALIAIVVLQPNGSDPQPPVLVQESMSSDSQQLQPASVTVIAAAPAGPVDPAAQQRLREYIEAMRFDPEEPVHIEHLQDSPLYRLVNEFQAQP